MCFPEDPAAEMVATEAALRAVLLVSNLFHPVNGFAVERLLDGNMRQSGSRRCAVPVLLTRLEPDHVSRMNLLDRATVALHPAAACRDDQDLAERMGVPRRARARLKGDRVASRTRRRVCSEQGVDPYRA